MSPKKRERARTQDQEIAALRAQDVAAGSRQCRVCGCTQNVACPGGCSWVEDDLCSECAA